MVIWIYGLSGSGKTTLAKKLYEELIRYHPRLILLDGEELRRIFPSIGHDPFGRVFMGEIKFGLAALLAGQGCEVILTGVSWRQGDALLVPDYFDIFLDIPIEECRRRDPTGLYASGGLNVVVVDLEYQRPRNPKLTISAGDQERGIQYCVDLVLVALNAEKEWVA